MSDHADDWFGPHLPRIALIAAFTAGLVTAQLLAVKILELSVPGSALVITVPAGVLAYSITFLATDCYTELYGRREAQVVVNVGFASILLMLGLLWLAIVLPGDGEAGVDPALFEEVVAPSSNVIVASLLAYVIAQNWDVFAFHRIRQATGQRLLWVRNLGSTATSQGIDTVVFIVVAFWAMPTLVGIGHPLPWAVIWSLIVGQYVVKVLIALFDTPLVYLVVGTIRRHPELTVESAPAD